MGSKFFQNLFGSWNDLHQYNPGSWITINSYPLLTENTGISATGVRGNLLILLFLFAVMLHPPLSRLSDYLLSHIVDRLAESPYLDHLQNLSIADRAFTQFCQAHIFKELQLGAGSDCGTKKTISMQLEKMGKILDDKPTFADRVRKVEIIILHKQNRWFFSDPTFISIVQLLAKSPIPPHRLNLCGSLRSQDTLEDPIFVVGQLMQTFFSQTLTVLCLAGFKNAPLTLLLICPRLRDILLDHVEAEKSYETYPEEQCSALELPALERLNYRCSGSLVKQMIAPPPRFHTAVFVWSKLRVLTLCPHEKVDVACLQPILDAARTTLEELYLTNIRASAGIGAVFFYRNEAKLIGFPKKTNNSLSLAS